MPPAPAMATFPVTYPDQTPETKEDAIIRVAAYDRKDHRKWVINFPDSEHQVVAESLSKPFGSPSSQTNLGSLGKLPLEILQQVCLELDVESCFRFRQVNRYAREAVTDLRCYRAVATHALDCFAALLRTEIGRFHTFQDVYAQFCTQECQRCGTGFGTFLYLPTLARRCATEFCLQGAVPRTLNSLSVSSGISKAEIRRMKVPVMRTLPGRYTLHSRSHQRRVYLVDTLQAFNIIERARGEKLPAKLRSRPRPLALNHCNVQMAMVKFPFYVPSTDKAYHGFNCAGCAMKSEVASDKALDTRPSVAQARYAGLEKVHTRSGFLKHFKECARAEDIWIMYGQGSSHFDHDIPRIVKNGGLSLGTGGWVVYPPAPARYALRSRKR